MVESVKEIVNLENKIEEATSPQEVCYSCGNCRIILFKESDLVEHTSQVKQYNARKNKSAAPQVHCNSLYLDAADWMNLPLDGITQEGKIYCPNAPKCNQKLGSFAHFGAQCSCGRWVNPAYQINASKVDKVFPTASLGL